MPRCILPGRHIALAGFCAPLLLIAAVSVHAQVFTVEPEHVEKHYTNFPPTRVSLPAEPLNTAGREQLIRFIQSEHGFAMRPLPVGNLTLMANGHMDPTGDKYVNELHSKGIAARPGDRVVVTNVMIRDNHIILDLNNGPYHKHRFLRHVSIGMDPYYTNPVVADDGTPPSGSRLTLEFEGKIPDLTGEQLEELLKPMIDFGVKSQAEAYAESLPPFLRKAIEQHRVLIGMDKDMVMYAKGQPIQKIREEKDGQPFEIWMYGQAPDPVEFVRFQGSFVIRVEDARVGEPLQVRTANEMGDYWGTEPVVATNQHQIEMGDRTAADVNQENAPKSPPTLRNPGEQLPTDSKDTKTMAPVNFPKDQQRPGDPGYTPPAQTGQQPANGTGQQTTSGAQQTGSGSGSQPAKSTGSQQQQQQEQPNPLDAPAPQTGPTTGQPSSSSSNSQH